MHVLVQFLGWFDSISTFSLFCTHRHTLSSAIAKTKEKLVLVQGYMNVTLHNNCSECIDLIGDFSVKYTLLISSSWYGAYFNND